MDFSVKVRSFGSYEPIKWGGADPTILPLAPTELFGQYMIIPTAFSRVLESLRLPRLQDWGMTLLGLLIYGAIAWPVGRRWRFWLPTHPFKTLGFSSATLLRAWGQYLIVPVMLEELVFRVLLLPHPTEAVQPLTLAIWLGFSLGLFVLSYVLKALSAAGNPMFLQPAFLILMGGLGGTCTWIYLQTGSLWPPVLGHWIVIGIWLFGLGGAQKLHLTPQAPLNR